MGAGYNEKLNIHYDEEYHFGNTKVYIVAPKITPEENQRRWERVSETARRIVKVMVERGETDKLMKKA